MADRLISLNAALEAFGLSEKTRKYGGDYCSGYNTIMLYEVQDTLEALPDAELEAIKRYTKAMHEWLLNYKKEVAEIELQGKYMPNEILSLFLDDWEKEWLT